MEEEGTDAEEYPAHAAHQAEHWVLSQPHTEATSGAATLLCISAQPKVVLCAESADDRA